MNSNNLHSRPRLRIILLIPLVAVLLLGNLFTAIDASAGNTSAFFDPYWGSAVKDAPGWLEMTGNPSDLYSEYEFVSLAGRLITFRVVDASECPGGGLLPGGTANDCGLQKALPAVYDWQNRFNKAIIAASRDVGVPPVLLKNVFAWESQFWPESVFVNTYEYGLGHLTEMGADSAMRWNAPFYDSICAKSFHAETCQKPYADQPASIQAALRGVVIQQVNADCPTCAYGLDIPLTERSIPVFAHTLAANATFVKWYVSALTGRPAAEVVTYENLWKFTLTSYNAGPGCFSIAFTRIRNARMNYDWKNLASKLDPACKGAIPYVDFISKTEQYHPENDPALIPTATPTPTSTSSPTEVIPTEITPQETPDDPASSTPPYQDPAETGEGTPVEPHEGSPTSTPFQATPGDPTSTAMLETSETPVAPIVTPVSSQPAPSPLPASSVPFPHVSDQVVVKLEPQHRETTMQLLKDLGASLVQGGEQIELPDTFIVQIVPGTLDDVLATLQESGVVAYAEPNYLVKLAGLPGDPEFPRQTNLWAVQAPQAWNALPSMQEVVVAVLDTGVELTHPDLADSLWLNSGELGLDASGMDRRSNGLDDDGNGYIDDWLGWNMVAGNNMPQDDHGHGTHLSGIIAAVQNNNLGIAGVAPNARILPVKVLDASGFGSYSQVAEGIIYATNMGARIINLGFGGEAHSQLMQEAIDYALARGVIVVAAGGNSGTATTYYPAGYPGVIAVSAIDENLNWAPFSSSGAHISLAAPGLSVFSTWRGSYRVSSGTSMASAHVSGVAALLAGQPQFSDAISIRSALIGGALDRGNPGQDTYFGYGVVQAFGALQYAGPILPPPTPWVVKAPVNQGGVYAMALQELWGRSQITTYLINNPANSIDGAFNDLTASSTGEYGGSGFRRWTFTSLDDTTLGTVAQVYLDIRLSITGWVDDAYDIQIYEPSNPACILEGYCIVQILQPDNGVPPAEVQPPSALTTLTYDLTSILNTIGKVNAAQVRIAGRGFGSNGTTETVTISIDGVRIRVYDSIPPSFVPTPTLPARLPTATPVPGEPHGHVVANTDQCAACHRMHTAQSLTLRSGPSEEDTCFACHTTAGSGTNVQPAFTSYLNSLTRFFKHDVVNTNGVHLLNESEAARFGGANRHVECEDCHNPHTTSRAASGGSYAAPSIAQEIFNTSGVDPIWEAPGAPTGYTFLQTAEREYQLCLKCHSSYTTLPTYRPDGFGWNGSGNGYVANGLFKLDFSSATQLPDSRDLAKEFNPYQASFHPVAAQGRNRNIPAGSFVTGWSQDSMVYCTDCHSNANAPTNGSGPHGSPRLHILTGWADYITKVDPNKSCTIYDDGCEIVNSPGELCFKCHQYGTYVVGTNPANTTRFRNGSINQNLHVFHSFATCYTCHDTHGSEQLYLINFDTSVVSIYPGYNSQSAYVWNGSINNGTCYVACHGGGHGTFSKSYTP